MERLIVTDPVPGCPLDSAELSYMTVPLLFEESNGDVLSESVRVFFPKTVNGGQDYVQFYVRRLGWARSAAQGETRQRYDSMLRQYAAGVNADDLDPRHERRFDLATLTAHRNPDEYTSFDDLRRTINVPGLPNLGLMLRVVRNVPESVPELVAKSVYDKPAIRISLSPIAHAEFREHLIDEILEARSTLEGVVRREFRRHRRRLLSGGRRTDHARQRPQERLERAEPECVDDALRFVLSRAVALESERALKFQDIVKEARRLHDEVGAIMEKRGMIAEDGRVKGDMESLHCFLEQHLRIESVDQMLDALLVRLRQVYGLTESKIGRRGTSDSRVTGKNSLASIAGQDAAAFGKWRRSRDPFDKWGAVCCVLSTYVNRNESVRLILRECEQARIRILHGAHLEILKKIRRHLTRAELRLFLVMYCALPALGGRISILDPPIESFYRGMDEETQALFWLVCIFKIKSWGGNENLDQGLTRRFRAYLNFYPYWLIVIREDERETKHVNRHASREDSIWNTVELKKDGEILREQIVPGTKPAENDPLRALVHATSGTVREWIEKYCRSGDVPRMIKRFEQNLSETEIARQEGVTQQAISLTLIRGCRDLRKGLIRDFPQILGDCRL